MHERRALRGALEQQASHLAACFGFRFCGRMLLMSCIAHCRRSVGFVGALGGLLFLFFLFRRGSLMPESLRRIFSRSSLVLARPRQLHGEDLFDDSIKFRPPGPYQAPSSFR